MTREQEKQLNFAKALVIERGACIRARERLTGHFAGHRDFTPETCDSCPVANSNCLPKIALPLARKYVAEHDIPAKLELI